MKYLYFYIVFTVLILNCEAQNSTQEILEDLVESEKYTFGFLNKLLYYWELVHTDTTISIEAKTKIYDNILSSQKLEKDERLNTIINYYIKKQNGRISYLNTDLGKHEVFIKIPIRFKTKNEKLCVNFIRVKTNTIYSWKITDIYFGDTLKYVSSGLKEIQIEKNFSAFIDHLSRKENIFTYFYVNPSFQLFLDDYDSIFTTNKSYNISLKYQITELPYFNKKKNIIGYKYLTLVKDIANNTSKKHGWHILDEGEMCDYFRLYDKNNVVNFYLNQEPLVPNK